MHALIYPHRPRVEQNKIDEGRAADEPLSVCAKYGGSVRSNAHAMIAAPLVGPA